MTGQHLGVSPIDQAVIEHVRSLVAARQWLVVRASEDAVVHTVGLTAFRLPELVIVAPHARCGVDTQLDGWAARLVAGDLELGGRVRVHDLQLREHLFVTRRYEPAHCGDLPLARALYGRFAVREIDVASCECAPCRGGLYHPRSHEEDDSGRLSQP